MLAGLGAGHVGQASLGPLLAFGTCLAQVRGRGIGSSAPVNLHEDPITDQLPDQVPCKGFGCWEHLPSPQRGLCVCARWACFLMGICTNPPLPVSGQAAVE